MRLAAAILAYVAASTTAGLFLGMAGGGLRPSLSVFAMFLGLLTAIAAYLTIPKDSSVGAAAAAKTRGKYGNPWLWSVVGVFALFAFRSFAWLYYYDGDMARIQSPNNLGDLGLHLSYIRTFANGVGLWPESPLFVFSKLRYPAGVDLFNGILLNVGFDLRHQLVLTGLVAAALSCYLFYRWGGAFAVAGFLFNGGVAGYQFLNTLKFLDYEGGRTISWKSIPLAMFVTQRGLLYAIPAGILLLWQWRARFGEERQDRQPPLPWWIEFLLYASMPLFHVHTFVALSLVVATIFLTRPHARLSLLKLAGGALLPAAFFAWLITDNLHAKSVFAFHFGWTQTGNSDFAMPFLRFWFVNFGIFLPLMIALVGLVFYEEWKARRENKFELSMDATFLIAAILIFLVVLFVKLAPWEWDNNKVLIWSYFIVLPLLWRRLLLPWPLTARSGACGLLFFSGFISLFGGMTAGNPGYEFASRTEVDAVGAAIRKLPVDARFAAFPTYNHPLLLNGRRVVCGYPGHLWTQGIDYNPTLQRLQMLMLGQGDWRQTAHDLQARYLFWGEEEKRNYPNSAHPWEGVLPVVAQGSWGAIYDFGPPSS